MAFSGGFKSSNGIRSVPALRIWKEVHVEREISRQASKKKSVQKMEEQYKKAMEEDPSVFDYDGVYDTMKQQVARPKIQDRTERKSKYIETLMEKAKQREREHEIVYERKLLKERSKEDHLFADKEKFVTSAYKKKLAEQAKWLEEERQLKILEEREDVTKKSDLSDFYFGLNKNVAFGAQSAETTKVNERGPAKVSRNLIIALLKLLQTQTTAKTENKMVLKLSLLVLHPTDQNKLMLTMQFPEFDHDSSKEIRNFRTSGIALHLSPNLTLFGAPLFSGMGSFIPNRYKTWKIFHHPLSECSSAVLIDKKLKYKERHVQMC
ncbi:hypothetical protein ZIOFF_028555 [Zingiber officinale]|uniref:Nuclear speckle splicing regulatory protein 1 N-terminal domain-containing protein n=1 Tax=Zingiber officinale TaxID=94328 RepID=A0A8J5GV69_ZINOF|nr:hypothetical protein ZIOFF_028555 [Zingiber officinale]